VIISDFPRSHGLTFSVADSMSLLLLTQLFLKVKRSESRSAGRQGMAFRHIILLVLSLKFPKK